MISKRKRIFQISLILLILATAFGIAQPVLAFEEDEDGIIPGDAVINDDLIISFNQVVIDGTVNGNVFASGQDVIVNGTINGNLLINAASAQINGDVTGSIAMAGQTMELNSQVQGTIYFAGASLILGPETYVNRNILFTGYSLDIQKGASIARDITFGGYQFLSAGNVDGDLDLDAGAVEISGNIGGSVLVKVPEPGQTPNFGGMEAWVNSVSDLPLPEAVKTGIRISDQAQINGDLTYVSPIEQGDAIQSSPAGEIEYQISKPVETHIGPAMWLLARLRELLTLLALGALILWKFPKLLHSGTHKIQAKPLPALGWGLVVCILSGALGLLVFLSIIFLGILLAIVTLGGLAGIVFGLGFTGFAFGVAAFTVLVIFVSKLVTAFWMGNLFINRFAPAQADKSHLALLVGIFVYVLCRAIPGLNVLIALLATLFGLGGMWLIIWDKKNAKAITPLIESA